MRVFVTGATGFIGIQLVKRLAGQSYNVHALYRSESKADLIRMKGVTLFKGDVMDKKVLSDAMEGCEQVYHLAAFAATWSRDPGLVYRINVEGTMNVINAASGAGIKRIVITSTAGVLGPSDSAALDESSPPPASFFVPYEDSKFRLEQKLLGRTEKDPELIIVNPTRVFGPGILNISNGVTKMIKRYVEGRWRYLPGDGNSSGNYVFVEDVVAGHLLAMERGRSGERYVLGGQNISYKELFNNIREISGIHRRLYNIPLWLMLMISGFLKGWAKLSGRPPLIVPGLVRKYNHNWIVSSGKAKRELGYDPISVKDGIRKTLEWITFSKR
jgi:farnesol dehydrogenase